MSDSLYDINESAEFIPLPNDDDLHNHISSNNDIDGNNDINKTKKLKIKRSNMVRHRRQPYNHNNISKKNDEQITTSANTISTTIDNITNSDEIEQIELENSKRRRQQQRRRRQQKVCMQSIEFVPKTIKYGNEYIINDIRFIMNNPKKSTYVTEMKDYTLITDEMLLPTDYQYIPMEIKRLLSDRWYFVIHVSHGMTPSINRTILRARVTGGELLAYKYVECSIEGNECVYYGYLPTIHKLENSEIAGTHLKCRISSVSIWPRKLYIYLKRDCICRCSDNCWYWSVQLENRETIRRYCFKKIPWNNLYIMMGENDESCAENLKEPRICEVCAQCFECSNSPNYCRRHKKCTHKRSIMFNLDENNTNIVESNIKSCNKFKLPKN